MSKRFLVNTFLSVALWYANSAPPCHAQSRESTFVPFNRFLEDAKAADSIEFIRPGSGVQDAAAFETMRQHILMMYRDVEVTHSFVLNSSHFDCVPVDQQPSVRILGLNSIATAPPQPLLSRPSDLDGPPEFHPIPATQLSAENKTDGFGNTIGCPQGSIPMRRITLEEMSQFHTLRDFLRKGPGNGGQLPKRAETAPSEGGPPGHKYSVMFQNVDNWGGGSNLNLWSPYVITSWNEKFSLSQEWYASADVQQTAEVGWQNFPTKYGNEESRLFIYWTADGYDTTGCYNLDCPGFVQIRDFGILGGGFTHYSTHGGPQYEFTAEYRLFQGNWWLAIQGTWVGYFPGAIYRGGQLTHNAQVIEFGTESLAATVWPAEGSGEWATTGFESAAYQRKVYYHDEAGGNVGSHLTAMDLSPSCYLTSGPFFNNTSGTYFFEGGPGGPGC
jgi:hypothetical protein